MTVHTNNLPAPRFGHTAVIRGDTMYVFGGKREDSCSNELCLYNTKTKEWTISILPITPRYHHTMCLHENTIYIIGGRDDSNIFNHVFSIDCDNFLVTEMTPLPNSRYGHVSYFHEMLHVYGGCDHTQDFNIGGWTFTENQWIQSSDSPLLHGCVHSSVYLPHQFNGGTIVHQKLVLEKLSEENVDIFTIILDFLTIRELSKIICTGKRWKIAKIAQGMFHFSNLHLDLPIWKKEFEVRYQQHAWRPYLKDWLSSPPTSNKNSCDMLYSLVAKYKKSLEHTEHKRSVKTTKFHGAPSIEEALQRYTKENTEMRVLVTGDYGVGKSSWVCCAAFL